MPQFVIFIDDGRQTHADGRCEFASIEAAVEATAAAALAMAHTRAELNGAHQRLSCEVCESGTDDRRLFDVNLAARYFI